MTYADTHDALEVLTAPDSERTVLGALLLDGKLVERAEALVQPRHMASERNRLIYEAILAVRERGAAIDLVTVKDELADRGQLIAAGGPVYLAELLDGIPRIEAVEHWAGIVREKARRRATRDVLQRALAQVTDPGEETDALIDNLRSNLERLVDAGDRGIRPIKDYLVEASRELEEFAASKHGLMGVPTGLPDLDRLTGGLRPGRLWIVAAFTSRGKSALSTQIAVHAAQRAHKVLLYSMEMPPPEVCGRVLMGLAGVERIELRHETAWAKLAKAHGEVAALPLWFDPRESPSIAEIRASARRHKATTGCDLIVVDYIQRIAVDGKQDRWQAVGDAVRSLKSLARNLNVPVLATCQLNTGAEDKRPGMVNLAQSAQVIAAEADVIGFLHPADMREWSDYAEALPGVSLFVDKHRGGPRAEIKLRFQRALTKFFVEAPEPAADWRG